MLARARLARPRRRRHSTADLDAYRQYIGQSRGEFTVAKDQNVRLRSGWFSDRSASYLACGRPVITQETGFSNVLPTGEGLFALLDAGGDSRGGRAHQRRLRAPFAGGSVPSRASGSTTASCWARCSITSTRRPGMRSAGRRPTFPADLVLTPVSRWPTTLPEQTQLAVMDAPIASRVRRRGDSGHPAASIVVVTFDGLVFTRLCLESLLAADTAIAFEVIVVDNASTDGTPEYLRALARRGRTSANRSVSRPTPALPQRPIVAPRCRAATSSSFSTTTPSRSTGWLDRLVAHLGDERIGLIGATTNRAGNEAEIGVPYRTYGELEQFARDHARSRTRASVRHPDGDDVLRRAAARGVGRDRPARRPLRDRPLRRRRLCRCASGPRGSASRAPRMCSSITSARRRSDGWPRPVNMARCSMPIGSGGKRSGRRRGRRTPGGHGLTTTRWSRACVSWCTTPFRPGPRCWSSARATTSSSGSPIAAAGIFHRARTAPTPGITRRTATPASRSWSGCGSAAPTSC